MNKAKLSILLLLAGLSSCVTKPSQNGENHSAGLADTILSVKYDEALGSISVFRKDRKDTILVQHAGENLRPYIHPIVAPDGNGVLTEFSPGHHTHQTGLFWGFTRLNGRDYFHHTGEDYWKRVSARVI